MLRGIAFDTECFGGAAIKHFNEQYMQPLGVKDMTDADLSLYSSTLEAGKAESVQKL